MELLQFIAVNMVVPVANAAMYASAWVPSEIWKTTAMVKARLLPLQLLTNAKTSMDAMQNHQGEKFLHGTPLDALGVLSWRYLQAASS